MKKSTLAATLSTLITLSSGAHALELIVVKNYDGASAEEIWKKAKTDQVPSVLLSKESVEAPSASYASIFPKTFLQEDLFAVCHHSCDDKEIFKERNGEISSRDLDNWNVVEQSNVYFWLKKYFHYLDEKLTFTPKKFLKVMTDRELKDETKGKIQKNNAFFNPRDTTLSFLPASKNLLFKIMGGKINRSGFDPSVVAHEASHFLFQHLFPNSINDEIGGLNEGFADYIANTFLENPKVGMVMMHGKALRDSSSPIDGRGKIKSYAPGMEVHDLGERVAFALWKSRELAVDKVALDQLVIDAVADLGQNPYSTVHDFKVKMIERLPEVIHGSDLNAAIAFWEIALEGKPIVLDNTKFLSSGTKTNSYLGFATKQVLPSKLAEEYGMPAVTESNFSVLKIEKISETQVAFLMATEDERTTTPYWVAVDAQRENVLGIYGLDKELVTDSKELEVVSELAGKAKGAVTFVKDFTDKLKSFSELVEGKGDFSLSYKVKKVEVKDQVLRINGLPVRAHKVTVSLKRKFLTGVLFGVPEIDGIELYTLPNVNMDLPVLNGEKVVGYNLQLKTGTAMEVILNKFPTK